MPGYCDPPKHSQFKPGQSGNPKGGPRGPRRKPELRASTFLDTVIKRKIGGRPFEGTRRQAIPWFAALWSVSKPIPGSSAPGASEQAKRTKPDLRLQQLLMKLAEQEDAIDRRIQRDKPSFTFVAMPSAADGVNCIEDAADVAGFGTKAYHKQKSARVLLENWVIEEGLARLGDRRLTRAEQELVLAAARFPKKMQWPDWWQPNLRERGKNWRAPQVAKNVTPPTLPETIRMGFKEYWAHLMREKIFQDELAYAREYRSLGAEDRQYRRKPFERPEYRG